MYMTYYVSQNNEIWSIFVINGEVFANPVSFNYGSDLDVSVLLAENEWLISYNNAVNKFYINIPKESMVMVKIVDRISADTLDKLTVEEVGKL